MTRTRAHGQRPFAEAALALGLALTSLLAVAAPANAAVVPPWRWVRVDLQNQSVPANSNAPFQLFCPGGYVPINGGVHSPNNAVFVMREYVDPPSNSYVMVIGNWTPNVRPVQLITWCANTEDVGPIVTVSADYPEVNNRAGGTTTCPDGYGAIGGGTDWYTFGDRHVDFSGPTPLGDGWFASGTSSATNDTLAIEVRCIPNASLPDETTVLSSIDIASNNGDVARSVTCPSGKRVLTGGSWAGPIGTSARDTAARGTMFRNTPVNAATWSSGASVLANSRFTAVALCIPVSTPQVTITQTPPALSTSSSGTFTFTASDPAGETLQFGCSVGFVNVACTPGSPVGFGPLSDGPKTIQVTAVNTSGISTFKSYSFTIDTTPPTVPTKSPETTAGLTETFTMQFSEPVAGVNGTSLRVFAEGSANPVPGTLDVAPTPGAATSATWTPTSRLMPGQKYSVQFGPGIHDVAGWPLSAPTWQVRADPNVENTSPAVVEAWDPDDSSKANGGHYISSRTKASSARLTFKAPSSGEVSVYGMRLPSGGYAGVFLDGVHQTKASFYAASVKRARVFHKTGLTPGSSHTLELRVLGTKPAASHGTWVALDSVTLGTTVKQETALKQSLRRVTDPGASGGSFDTVSHTTGGDTGGSPSYKLTFRGTSIRLKAILSPGSGKAAIYVDGVMKKTANLVSAGLAYDVSVFFMSLPDGVHKIKVVPVGTTGGSSSSVGVDRFVVG